MWFLRAKKKPRSSVGARRSAVKLLLILTVRFMIKGFDGIVRAASRYCSTLESLFMNDSQDA